MPSTREAPTNGETVITTTTRRVSPGGAVSELAGESQKPDFWQYVESLKPEDWSRHVLYIYRRLGDSGPMPQCERIADAGSIRMVDGTRIALTDQDQIEYAIAQKFGGGTYRLILKRMLRTGGSERVAEARVISEGPPKPIVDLGAPGLSAGPMDSTADVAKTAITTIAGQDAAAVRIGVEALTSAANVIKTFTANPPAPVSNPVTDQILSAALARLMAPPPDPIETFVRLMAVMNQQHPPAVGSPENPIVNKIIETGLERILNPAPSGPNISVGAELVHQIPTIVSRAGQAIADWKTGMEAQRDAIAIANKVPMQPPAPGRPGTVATHQPPPGTILPPVPTAAPLPPSSAPPGGVMGPPVEFIQQKIVDIMREPQSVEACAEEAIDFLDRLDPNVIPQLAALGERGLLAYFEQNPILQPMCANMPRLLEFIRAFLKYAVEDQGEEIPPIAGSDPTKVN